MKVAIRVRAKDRAKVWGFLVRHSPGMALPDRVFLVSDEAARALREAGFRFTVLSRDVSGATSGERI
jgi:hypothetical protein